MSLILLFLALFIALFLEATIIQLPLVLVVLLTLTILYQREWIFITASALGLLLDIFLFRPLGETSIFFLFITLIVFLFRQKYELKTAQFAGISSGLGSFFYLLFFGSSVFVIQIVVSILLGIMVFLVWRKFSPVWIEHI